MITRIEIDGFKTFQDFTLELGPFQVIVGTNGAGKSNLFDALQLLRRLSLTELAPAFQGDRGEAGELFRRLPDGQPTNHIKMAVELFVDRHIKDKLGEEAELTYTRLRYEVHIERRPDGRGLERLYVTHEQLAPLAREEDTWVERCLGAEAPAWLPQTTDNRSAPFISTDVNKVPPTITLHEDGASRGSRTSVAERVEQTILSSVTTTEFLHVFAVREEIRIWGFLRLNPELLREPSPITGPVRMLWDSSNLPSALAHIYSEDPLLIKDVSRNMANLVPGIVSIEVEEDRARNRYLIQARTEDGNIFSSRVLSDGTLRMLALVTLKNDPWYRGVLCFEEPENGVHPFRLQQMAQLLRDLTTDFNDPEQRDLPLRQLLVNTHSPVFAGQPEVANCLLFAQMVQRVKPGENGYIARVTRITPVITDPQLHLHRDISNAEQQYTLDQVKDFLQRGNVPDSIEVLHESQT